MIYIGIDPGKSGAVACINEDRSIRSVMPFERLSPTDIADELYALDNSYGTRAVIEQVGASPQQGRTSAFTFGEAYGMAWGILTALGIGFDRVRPQKWQKEFGLIQRGRKLGDTEKKRINKAKCQELFGGIKITNAIADALLLAEYCRRVDK